MGKARQRKQWRKVYQGAMRLEAESSKPPCATCAFRDPEAWIADHAMAKKVLESLRPDRLGFFCHGGFPVDEEGYQPPRRADGQIDFRQLTPCGGFLRWALHWRGKPVHEQQEEVLRLQRHFLERYLSSDAQAAGVWNQKGLSAAEVQMGLNLMAEMEIAESSRKEV